MISNREYVSAIYKVLGLFWQLLRTKDYIASVREKYPVVFESLSCDSGHVYPEIDNGEADKRTK